MTIKINCAMFLSHNIQWKMYVDSEKKICFKKFQTVPRDKNICCSSFIYTNNGVRTTWDFIQRWALCLKKYLGEVLTRHRSYLVKPSFVLPREMSFIKTMFVLSKANIAMLQNSYLQMSYFYHRHLTAAAFNKK